MRPKGTKAPTKKQITAMQLLANDPNISPRQAMIKAGYSKNVAGNPTRRLFQSEAVKSMGELFPVELAKFGITLPKLAEKYAEHLNATKSVYNKDGGLVAVIPDYQTQTDARKDLKDIFNLTPKKQELGNVSRKIELTEYLNG